MDLSFDSNQIIIKPNYTPRKGWGDAFKQMHTNGEDKLLINDIFQDEDFE